MSELLVGRQPILNRQKATIGYELLYRSVQTDTRARVSDGNLATSQVFVNTMFEMGLQNIVGGNLAFINFTRDFLVKNDLVQLLTNLQSVDIQPQKIVLEVLEDISLDEELFRELTKLKQKGFIIALDDVVSYNAIAPILPTGLVNLVKIDLMGVDRLILPSLVGSLKGYGIRLLAEKVETPEDFALCRRLGFDYFQGYFFYKPETIRDIKKRMDVSRLNLTRSLAATMNPMADFRTLEPIVSQDVGLSYKLLRLVNSGYFSLANQIRSIQQAISLIGMQQLRSWMTLLLMATVDDKPHELTFVGLQRAKMCESLGKLFGEKQTESYFLTGMLSVLDAIMDIPMAQVVENLSLAPEISQALVERGGKAGMILTAVTATENGNWDYVLQFGIGPDKWREIYFEAVKWSGMIMNEVSGDQMLD